MDLVEIAAEAKPPVVRLVDYRKFKYELSKREQEARKKTQEVQLKEVRMGPFISEHDLAVRVKRTQSFLEKGDRVKVSVKFGGRQMGKQQFGHQLLAKIQQQVQDLGKVDRPARMEGRLLSIIMSPVKIRSK